MVNAKGWHSAALDSLAATLREKFGLPALAIAAIHDGNSTTRAYGIRRVHSAVPVDTGSVFGIGSNTKAFTAYGLSLLAQEGLLSLDDPVRRHVEAFALADPEAARYATVRDLLALRCGLKAHAGDLLFVPPSTFSRLELVERLRYLPLEGRFRAQFGYSNLAYVAAGEVIAAVSELSWERFIRQSVLIPLGLLGAAATHAELSRMSNRAEPHMYVEDPLRAREPLMVLEPVPQDNAGAAISISASADDMARWLLVLLGDAHGISIGRVLKPKYLEALWTCHVPVRDQPGPESLKHLPLTSIGYGLGFRLYSYRGMKVALHGGGTYGYASVVAIVPERRAGFALLTNADHGSEAMQAGALALLDGLSGEASEDWAEDFSVRRRQRIAEAEEMMRSREAKGAESEAASLELATCTGMYLDPWCGQAQVILREEGLDISFERRRAMKGKLERWRGDTFRVRWTDRTMDDALLTFRAARDRLTVAGFEMAALSPLADPSFDYADLNFHRA